MSAWWRWLIDLLRRTPAERVVAPPAIQPGRHQDPRPASVLRNLEALRIAWERAIAAREKGDRRLEQQQFDQVRNRQQRLALGGLTPPETLREAEDQVRAVRSQVGV